MVKVTFKDVGQGDSIILEWHEGESKKVGIVDCNLYKSSNPVLNHIQKAETSEIEFMILSHPHRDHFSGFKQLLQYCLDNEISIDRFYHTAETTPDYLRSASRSVVADNELLDLFLLLKEMKLQNKINVYAINDNPLLKIPLGDEFTMEVLAPSSIEIDNYIRGVKYPFDEEESTANPNANWLSTVLKIYNEERTALLTSDVESNILSRLGKRKNGRIGNNKLMLGQAPHHGSKRNLNKTFWSMRRRNEITPIVLSVGKNGHGHPSEDVINFFNGLPNYKIERTDSTKLITQSNVQKENSSLLDVFSTKEIETTVKNNDAIFLLKGTGIVST